MPMQLCRAITVLLLLASGNSFAGDIPFATRVENTRAHFTMLSSQIQGQDPSATTLKRLYDETVAKLTMKTPKDLADPIFTSVALIRRPNGELLLIALWLTDETVVDHICFVHTDNDIKLRAAVSQFYLEENVRESKNSVFGRFVEVYDHKSFSAVVGGTIVARKQLLKGHLERGGVQVGSAIDVILLDLMEAK